MKLISELQALPGRNKIGPLRALKAKLISGTVKAIFEDGNGGREELTLTTGDTFELPFGFMWKSVEIFVADGAYGVIRYGIAGFGVQTVAIGVATGTDGIYSDAGADPNLASLVPLNPAAPAMYFPDVAAPGLWIWSVANQTWTQILA